MTVVMAMMHALVGDSSSASLSGTATDSSPVRGLAAASDSPVLRAGGVVLRRADSPSGDMVLHVLLVSRRRKPGSYTVPAGKFEEEVDGGSFESCALRETQEEAGVECEILSDLGWFDGVSKDGSLRKTRFFALLLLQESSAWEEAGERRRCWYPVEQAQQLVEHSVMLKSLLDKVAVMMPDLTAEVQQRTSTRCSGESSGRMHYLREQALNQQIRGDSVSSNDSDGAGRLYKTKAEKKATLNLEAMGEDGLDNDVFGGLLGEVENFEVPSPKLSPKAPALKVEVWEPPPPTPSPKASEPPSPGHRAPSGGYVAAPVAVAVPKVAESPAPIVEQPPQVSAQVSDRVSEQVSGQSTLRRSVSYEGKVKVVENIDGECFCFYEHQVGGHFCLVKPAPGSQHITVKPPRAIATGLGTVQVSASGVVLKPLNEHENDFYQSTLCEYPAFTVYTPQIFGTKTLTMTQVSAITANVDEKAEESFLGDRMRSHQCQHYIVMQDLASSMRRPRILDLKMGFKQRSKRHSARKRERCKAKAVNSTSHAIGFRICGMHMEDRSHDKYWGRELPLSGMRGALASFFLHDRATPEEQHRMLTHLTERLRGLHATASLMLGWRFWNTSLLFLHDGASPGSMADCRLIDFAHCTRVRSRTPDEEFLSGLRNLMVFLEAVRDDRPHEPWIAERLTPHPSGGRDQDAEEIEDEADSDDEAALAASVAGAAEGE